MFLHFVHSISHCYSDGGMAQHTYIVSSVAKCHCFFQANTEVIDDFVDTLLFGISFGGDIGKGRKPTPGFAVRQLGKNLFFLLQCNERCHLEDFPANRFFRCLYGKHIYFQIIVEYLFHHIVRLADADIMFAYKDTGEILFGGDACQCLYVSSRNRALVNHFFTYETISAVHGYITVY